MRVALVDTVGKTIQKPLPQKAVYPRCGGIQDHRIHVRGGFSQDCDFRDYQFSPLGLDASRKGQGDFITEPALNQSRGSLMRAIGMTSSGARGMASQEFKDKLYGDSPRTNPLRGSAQTLGMITVDEL